MNSTNGDSQQIEVELPPERQNIVEQAQLIHQQACAERDRLREENGELRLRIAELDKMVNSLQSMNGLFESHLITIRDEGSAAVAEARQYAQDEIRRAHDDRNAAIEHAAVLNSVLSSIDAVLRTTKIEAQPFIRNNKNEDES